MTLISPDSIVVYEVAINDHPVIAGSDDDRSDEELVSAAEGRTETAEDLSFPEWVVFVSDPPDDETVRYVNTNSRVNIRARYGTNPFRVLISRLTIDGMDMENIAMSAPSATHEDDFDGEIHLDLAGD